MYIPLHHLSAHREGALLTRSSLGRAARISPKTIGRIEAGHLARYSTVHRIAAALGVNARDLLDPPEEAHDAHRATLPELLDVAP